MKLEYTTKKVCKLCSDYDHAKKKLNKRTADNLHKCIQYLTSAANLDDVKMVPRYRNLELLKNTNTYSIAFEGKKSSYRLIFYIIKESGERLTNRSGIEEYKVFKATKCIEIKEVSKHYE